MKITKVFIIEHSIGFLMWENVEAYTSLTEATKRRKSLQDKKPKDTYRVVPLKVLS